MHSTLYDNKRKSKPEIEILPPVYSYTEKKHTDQKILHFHFYLLKTLHRREKKGILVISSKQEQQLF